MCALYDFDFNAGDGQKPDLTIFSKGQVYISRQAIKRLHLSGVRLRWGEDKEQKTLALKKVPDGRKLKAGRTTCPPDIAERYAGKYKLTEEEGVLVLIKAEETK